MLTTQEVAFVEEDQSFSNAMSGLMMASLHPDSKLEATEFVRAVCRRILIAEVRRHDPSAAKDAFVPDVARKRSLSLTLALADCYVQTLTVAKGAERSELGDLLATVISDFRAISSPAESTSSPDSTRSVDRVVQNFAQRFAQLCHEEDWSSKLAGVEGFKTFVYKLDLSRRAIIDVEVDMMRALLFCLRDAPEVVPTTADEVSDLMRYLINFCQSQEDGKSKQQKVTETLVTELTSQSECSRQAAQSCLKVLAEVTSQSLHDLIAETAKKRLLDATAGPIFSKPLRALPFAMQVGNLDAVTFLTQLEPPLLDPTDEVVRLLQEVLALADVEDQNLVSKNSTHKQDWWLKTLRVACLRMLRAAVAAPDFMSKANLSPLRSKSALFALHQLTNAEVQDSPSVLQARLREQPRGR